MQDAIDFLRPGAGHLDAVFGAAVRGLGTAQSRVALGSLCQLRLIDTLGVQEVKSHAGALFVGGIGARAVGRAITEKDGAADAGGGGQSGSRATFRYSNYAAERFPAQSAGKTLAATWVKG